MENGEPSVEFMTFIAEGDKLYNNGKPDDALEFYNKALNLNPRDKKGLVNRSKCHLIKGDVNKALADAELSLKEDNLYYCGLYQKAEALYQKGDFELSLVFYHRGHKIRPELTCFTLGIQKASEAIVNSVGKPGCGLDQKEKEGSSSNSNSAAPCRKSQAGKKSNSRQGINKDDGFSELKSTRYSNRAKSAGKSTDNQLAVITDTKAQKELLGELYVDKEYLESLVDDEDLMNSVIDPSSSNTRVGDLVNSGIEFLTYKTEFWRQQKPLYARQLNTNNIPPASDPVNDVLRVIVNMEQIEQTENHNITECCNIAEREIQRIERCTEKQLQQAAIRAGSPLVSKNVLIGELCLQIGAICSRSFGENRSEKAYKKAEYFFQKTFNLSGPHTGPRNKNKAENSHNHCAKTSSQASNNFIADKNSFAVKSSSVYLSQKDNALDRLGRLYVLQNQLQKAIATWEQRELLLQKADNKFELVVLYHDIGRAYLTLKDYKKANEYAHMSYSMVVDSVWKMNVMVLLAEIHLACKEIDSAKRVLENCYSIAKQEKDKAAEKAVQDLLDRLRSHR